MLMNIYCVLPVLTPKDLTDIFLYHWKVNYALLILPYKFPFKFMNHNICFSIILLNVMNRTKVLALFHVW